jgi:large subunit ribosomal protein L6
MSRIGKLPIAIPASVTLTVDTNHIVTVKGPKGTLSQAIDPDINITVENGEVTFTRPTEQKRHRAMHGLYRALTNNMIVGVTEGYKISLEIVGVGFKAEVIPTNVLQMSLGYSHIIYFAIPQEVKVTAITEKGKNPIVMLESIDKQLLGHIAAKIKSLRKVEPYKGKGIREVGEIIRRKAGKTAKK